MGILKMYCIKNYNDTIFEEEHPTLHLCLSLYREQLSIEFI